MQAASSLNLSSQPFRRIVVSVPPHDWFHGIAFELFKIYRQALIDLGCSVFDVPVDAFLPPDMGRITNLLTHLRAFRPELAIGLYPGSYVLLCRLPPERDGWRPNLFIDVLELPTICIWDHAPVELADQLLGPLPDRPTELMPGAIKRLRKVLTNPRLVHWSRDTGQTRIMRELGFARPGQVVQSGTPALPGFNPDVHPSRATARADASVAFIGNFYQNPRTVAEPEIEALMRDAIRKWIAQKQSSLWDVVTDHIAALPVGMQQRLALERDQTFFWGFTHQLIVHIGQTVKRLRMLGAAGVPIAVYGNFRPDAPDVPTNLRAIPERFRFGPELAAALARHPITIDVLNPGKVDGYGLKAIVGFASGGFVLVDRKVNFVDAFGELGEAVSYRDADDLAAKVDRLLSNPRERHELGEAMRAEIRAKHTLDRVLKTVLRAAAEISHAGEHCGNAASQFNLGQRNSVLLNLLPTLQTHSHWQNARVEHGTQSAIVTTSPKPWAYAAEIPIAALPTRLREPHLRLSVVVETGRIGICLIRTQTGELISEQLVSATPQAVAINVELPQDVLVTLVLRNTVEEVTRARLLEVLLCERA